MESNWEGTLKNGVLHFKGSYLLRQRLLLSVLSGIPIRITHIRINSPEVGLREYEVNLIRLLDKVTNGSVVELNEVGSALYFQPGLLNGGHFEHDCNQERGIGYYLEVLIQLATFCKDPLDVALRGVTNSNTDPSVDFLQQSMLNVVRMFLLDDEGLDLKVVRRGVPPGGGGEVIFKCPVRNQLKPVHLTKWGMVKRIRGLSYALRVSPALANRMVECSKGVFLNFLPDVYINTVDQTCRGRNSGNSPGFGLHLYAETTEGVVYSAEKVSNPCGDNVTVPEALGQLTANCLLQEICCGGICDSICQPTVILFMALGPKDVSTAVVGPLTDYAQALLRNLKHFFGIMFKIEYFNNNENNKRVLLTCSGVGFKNISRRAL